MVDEYEFNSKVFDLEPIMVEEKVTPEGKRNARHPEGRGMVFADTPPGQCPGLTQRHPDGSRFREVNAVTDTHTQAAAVTDTHAQAQHQPAGTGDGGRV